MRRAVFLDKDGTLVQNVPYNVDPERVVLRSEAVPALRRLRGAGYDLVVVSNQSGVAHGYFDERAVQRILLHLRQGLALAGVDLLDCRYCPHHPEGSVTRFACACECRKPAPGMLHDAARQHGIDLGASFLVGDILDDVEAAHRAGCRAVLLDCGSETLWQAGPFRTPDRRVSDLLEAASWILAQTAAAEAQR